MARHVQRDLIFSFISDFLNLSVRLDLFYDARYSHTAMTNPNFILLAQAMGVHAIRCETAEELPAKMKEFLEYRGDKPVFMECLVETNEHVFPMVGLLSVLTTPPKH
jgi:acetolactate synthase-1/2/3 large subunit